MIGLPHAQSAIAPLIFGLFANWGQAIQATAAVFSAAVATFAFWRATPQSGRRPYWATASAVGLFGALTVAWFGFIEPDRG